MVTVCLGWFAIAEHACRVFSILIVQVNTIVSVDKSVSLRKRRVCALSLGVVVSAVEMHTARPLFDVWWR